MLISCDTLVLKKIDSWVVIDANVCVSIRGGSRNLERVAIFNAKILDMPTFT